MWRRYVYCQNGFKLRGTKIAYEECIFSVCVLILFVVTVCGCSNQQDLPKINEKSETNIAEAEIRKKLKYMVNRQMRL